MVKVYCNTDRYEYDIRALVMAFFPEEELCYRADAVTDEDNADRMYRSGEGHMAVCIKMEDNDMSVTAYSGKDNITTETDVSPESIGSGLYRDVLKRLIYRVLSKNHGIAPEWGTLTVVRPAKLPLKRLMQGEDTDSTVRYMTDNYYCSPRKAQLCTKVAETELGILNDIDYENGYSIYIGIPFCPSVCTYCSFSSTAVDGIPGTGELMENYINALAKECHAFRDAYPDKRLTSVYIGGGTPTALNEVQLKRLMDIVSNEFPLHQADEYTVEAGRPDSINEEKLSVLKTGGVTRISVNPQTMKEETLRYIGRRHTAGQTVEAYNMARMAGFDNINMDLIAGLPGEDENDFARTLEYIDRLKPDSYTVHSLVVKRASVYRQQRERGMGVSSSEVVDSMLDMAAEYAGTHGYFPYYMYRQKNKAGLGEKVLENVGYAVRGKEGIYNILIMEERQTILALGAGASGKIVYNKTPDNSIDTGVKRTANVKNIYEYISRIDEMIDRKKRCMYAGFQKNR